MNRCISILALWILVAMCILFGHSFVSPQEVVTALRHRAPSGTNIQFVGYAKFNTSSSQNALSGSYTCASTSNRLIIVGEYQNNTVATFTLTDTGGEASGAVVMLPLTVVGTTAGTSGLASNKVWNSACASGSNTYTVTGSGATAGIMFQIAEYSGITDGSSGSVATFTNVTGSPFAITGTASVSGMLAVAYVGMQGADADFHSVTTGYNYRTTNTPSGGDGGVVTSYPLFDNISVPSGSASFTMAATGSSHTGGRVILILVPGTAATSPNWAPMFIQSTSKCNTSTGNSLAFNRNVVAGDLLTFSYVPANGTSSPSSVTDSQGNTFTLQVTKTNGGPNLIVIYSAIAGSSAADTVTANGASGSACSQITEFNGPGNTVSDTGGQTTGAATMTWTQTVSTAHSVVYAACAGWFSTNTFFMTGVGFSSTSQANGNGAIGGSWARTVTTSSESPSFANLSNNPNVCASIVVH